jgi:hypothetical protein
MYGFPVAHQPKGRGETGFPLSPWLGDTQLRFSSASIVIVSERRISIPTFTAGTTSVIQASGLSNESSTLGRS